MEKLAAVAMAAAALYYARELPERARDIRDSLAGLAWAPAALVMGSPLALAAALASDHPVLGWSLFDGSVAAAPVRQAASVGSAGVLEAWLALAGVAALTVCLVTLVYYEELYFRDSWGAVAAWAAMHVLVGVPVAGVLPLLGMGAVYKVVRDRRGVGEAYVAHLAVNATALAVMAAALLVQ
jgi:hypothetical protein